MPATAEPTPRRPRRIAIVGNQAFAMGNFRGPLIRSLAERGHEVLAYAPDWTPDTRAAVAAAGGRPIAYRLERHGTNPRDEALIFLDLLASFRRERPDIALCYTVKPIVYGMWAARLAGIPRRVALVEGLGLAFGDGDGNGASFTRGVKLLYRLALTQAQRCLFLNAADRDDFIAWDLVGPEKTALLGATGLTLADWPVEPPHLSPPTFTMAARLMRSKGVREFVAAARLVRATHPEARFTVLGRPEISSEGIAEAELQGWVAEGLIDWPGHVPVQPWLRRTGVFVLPSFYREGVPRSLQEAMAMGRPVISTDIPGARDCVDEGRNGFLVPPRDPVALAAAMRCFLDDPSLIASMGAEGRRLAEQRFDSARFDTLMRAELGLADGPS